MNMNVRGTIEGVTLFDRNSITESEIKEAILLHVSGDVRKNLTNRLIRTGKISYYKETLILAEYLIEYIGSEKPNEIYFLTIAASGLNAVKMEDEIFLKRLCV